MRDILLGAAAVTAIAFVTSPTAFDLTSFNTVRGNTIEMKMQWVDRTNKGDRLDLPKTVIGRRHVPIPTTPPPKLIRGCEPAFSPLTTSAHGDNFARRCVASAQWYTATA